MAITWEPDKTNDFIFLKSGKTIFRGNFCPFLIICDVTCNFIKSNTPPWMFFTFLKLYKWYQITQNIKFDHFFQKNPAASRTAPCGTLTTCKVSEKTNKSIQENCLKDGKTDRRKDPNSQVGSKKLIDQWIQQNLTYFAVVLTSKCLGKKLQLTSKKKYLNSQPRMFVHITVCEKWKCWDISKLIIKIFASSVHIFKYLGREISDPD